MTTENATINDTARKLEEELNVIQSLRRKYPYLGKETETVGTEISDKLDGLSKKYVNLTSYQGPDYNLIDKDKDTMSVAEAKLSAQGNWIESNKAKENQIAVDNNASSVYSDY